jgi:hypothetical protein
MLVSCQNVGRTPRPRWTPRSGFSIKRQNKPTGASAAVQGDRPTNLRWERSHCFPPSASLCVRALACDAALLLGSQTLAAEPG